MIILSTVNANATVINWQVFLSSGITGLVTFFSVAWAAYLTYLFTKKHSHTAHNTSIKVDRLKRQVSSLETMWELLTYTNIGEGEHAMLRWRKGKKGNKKYFMHYGNLKAFLTQELGNAFYSKHAGLYLSSSIRDQFFEYRRVLMGFYLRYEKDKTIETEPLIELENSDLAEKINCKYNELNKAIKDELDKLYKDLQLNESDH